MVQKKVTNKLGIQAERVKTERLSINLKPSLQDVKNGGTDLKKKNKKMKKSGSIKRHEIETPPVSITKPNYMKPTTSSDARKEKPQASTKHPQTSPHTPSFRRKTSNFEKLGLASDKKAKTSARTTSLKLTSTPSFKVSAKKCSPVALCEDLDVQRATCSSTLKDCKFPTYLSLSPGGTELEGASAVKVCPYTYCSLNGHHHASLPPLKSFLSAKRRMIKTQRNVKLGCLSPKRANQMQEEQNDFFVEIFAPNEEDNEMLVKGCEKLVVEMVSDGIDQFTDQNGDINQTEEVFTPSLDEKEAEIGFLSETDSEASGMDLETGNESPVYLDDGYEESFKTEKEPDPEAGDHEIFVVENESFIKLDENIKNCFNEVLENEESQESFDEQSSWSSSDEEFINDSNDYVKIKEESFDTVTSDELQIPTEDHLSDESETCNTEKQGKMKKESNQDGKIQEAKESDSAEQEKKDSSLNKATTNCKKPIQDSSDESGPFNPRGPNFLPMEPELEGENVDLRHQELDERKNAEEWMVDFALRKVVTKLGVERKRKVALLVEAFEKVIPLTKCEINLAYSSAFESPRPIQACN